VEDRGFGLALKVFASRLEETLTHTEIHAVCAREQLENDQQRARRGSGCRHPGRGRRMPMPEKETARVFAGTPSHVEEHGLDVFVRSFLETG